MKIFQNSGIICYNQITLNSNNYVLSCNNPKISVPIILNYDSTGIIKNIYKPNLKIDNKYYKIISYKNINH